MVNWLYNKELYVPSGVDGLDMCLYLVNDICKCFNLDFEKKLSLHTIVVEAIENAIIHGNKGDKTKFVRFSIQVIKEKIFIRVEDEGDGFNIHSIPSPTLTSNIRNEYGRGIFFIKNLSESCSTLGRGNIIKIVMKR